MTQTNVTIAIAKTSVRTLAAGILMAAGFLAVSVVVPVVASDPAFARPPVNKKDQWGAGNGKRVKGRVGRASVRRACKSVNGHASGTSKGSTGGYSCANGKTGSWIDCNKWGECVGSTGKKKQKRD